MRDAGIVGRDEELRAISSFLEQSAGRGVLFIVGEAGIGKTTLWRAAVEAARELSYVVLSASPAEKEATFAYSVVSDSSSTCSLMSSESFQGHNGERSKSHSF